MTNTKGSTGYDPERTPPVDTGIRLCAFDRPRRRRELRFSIVTLGKRQMVAAQSWYIAENGAWPTRLVIYVELDEIPTLRAALERVDQLVDRDKAK